MERQQQPMQEGRGTGEGTDAPQLDFMVAKSFNCLIPILLTVIQVNNEGKDKSAFETHPAQMWVFVFSSVIYFSAAQLSVPMAIISGSLSSVSLLSVLLPRLLGALVFIPWAFVPLILACQIHEVLIRHACLQLHHKIKTIISTSIEQLRDACRLILAYQIHAVSIRNACRQLHGKINTIISSFSPTTSIEQQELPV
ncbi:hypothetical protein EZV62_025802 [Acer yangbiense]|uniref:Uncharacterized protein n=1 Tax=Acer yangbiense TaxID=1000413 RepID=A0A5C7GZI1_9ROSI|nr:hypothetical protein EZV62_025802 [Acer yangbiense]